MVNFGRICSFKKHKFLLVFKLYFSPFLKGVINKCIFSGTLTLLFLLLFIIFIVAKEHERRKCIIWDATLKMISLFFIKGFSQILHCSSRRNTKELYVVANKFFSVARLEPTIVTFYSLTFIPILTFFCT